MSSTRYHKIIPHVTNDFHRRNIPFSTQWRSTHLVPKWVLITRLPKLHKFTTSRKQFHSSSLVAKNTIFSGCCVYDDVCHNMFHHNKWLFDMIYYKWNSMFLSVKTSSSFLLLLWLLNIFNPLTDTDQSWMVRVL